MASNVDTFPTDGNAYTMTHPWDTVWAFINNASAVNVVVATDQGFKLTVPPGAGLPWSLPVPTRNLMVQSASASANGLVYITASDSLTGAQSYASNIVTGTVNANILNSNLNVTASGTVNANILNSVITANINNASLAVTDSIVETNTTTVLGILPNNISAFSTVDGVDHLTSIGAKPINGFALGINTLQITCFVDVYYVASGQTVYLLHGFPYYGLPDGALIEWFFSAPIPAAGQIGVRTTYGSLGLGLACVLKW